MTIKHPAQGTTDTRSRESLLGLLQVSDSMFPSGAFAHSYGLEQLVRDGRVQNAVTLEAFVASVIRQVGATSDAVAARAACARAADGDVDGIVAVDRALMRTKAAEELRLASIAVGRRLVEETALHVESPVLREYATRLSADRSLGTQPVAFGVVCTALAVDEADVAPALLQTAAAAILQAAMRLLPVSHRDVQAILNRLRPSIAAIVATLPDAHDSIVLQSFHPMQEIASMRHARAEARLFAS